MKYDVDRLKIQVKDLQEEVFTNVAIRTTLTIVVIWSVFLSIVAIAVAALK